MRFTSVAIPADLLVANILAKAFSSRYQKAGTNWWHSKLGPIVLSLTMWDQLYALSTELCRLGSYLSYNSTNCVQSIMEGTVFTGVCHSLCPLRGVVWSGGTWPGWGKVAWSAGSLPSPPSPDHPPPPRPGGRHTPPGRYASYWNAFLFISVPSRRRRHGRRTLWRRRKPQNVQCGGSVGTEQQ